MRTRWLLRFLQEQTRHQTLPPHQAPYHAFSRARRIVVLVLRRRNRTRPLLTFPRTAALSSQPQWPGFFLRAALLRAGHAAEGSWQNVTVQLGAMEMIPQGLSEPQRAKPVLSTVHCS